MENASKALLIAGGVLIAILLLTLFSYLFTQMASSTSSIYNSMSKHEIDEFNQQFLNYEGKEELTVQDVETLINLAEDARKNKKIEVKIWVRGYYENSEEWDLATRMAKKPLEKFKCQKIIIDEKTSLVSEVELDYKK